ncbi:MAG: glutamine synthetase family protein [bacterium]
MKKARNNSSKKKKKNLSNPIAEFLGKPPCDFTRQDIVRYAYAKNLRLLTLSPLSGDGRMKTLTFPITSKARLEEILDMGERVDGSNHFPQLNSTRSDIYIVPRYSTAFVNPFASIPTLVLMTACFGADERQFELCPYRLVMEAKNALAHETNLSTRFLGELEFYLIGPGEGTGQPGKTLYQESTPFVRFQNVRDEIIDELTSLGIGVKYAHAEVGGGSEGGKFCEQHEIEFTLKDPVEAADQLVIGKWVVRNIAARYNLVATFAPKIDTTLAGSGLHFHFQLLKDKDNILFTKAGEVSAKGLHSIGGLLKHTPSLAAFGNTVPTSYLRLLSGMEAPDTATWGEGNRSSLIRVPLGWRHRRPMAEVVNQKAGHRRNAHIDRKTIEFRLPDGSANVHLTIAGILVALRSGLKDKGAIELAQMQRIENLQNRKTTSKTAVLPCSCSESADKLEDNRKVYEKLGVFPPALIDILISRLRSYNDKNLARSLRKNRKQLSKLITDSIHCG